METPEIKKPLIAEFCELVEEYLQTRNRRTGVVRQIVRVIDETRAGMPPGIRMRRPHQKTASPRNDHEFLTEVANAGRSCGIALETTRRGNDNQEILGNVVMAPPPLFQMEVFDLEKFQEAVGELQSEHGSEKQGEYGNILIEGMKRSLMISSGQIKGLSENFKKLVISKNFAAIGVVGDWLKRIGEEKNHQAFLARVQRIFSIFAIEAKEIGPRLTRGHESKGNDSEKSRLEVLKIQEMMRLVMEFEDDLGEKIRVISTGDANLGFLQEADEILEQWIERAQWIATEDKEFALHILRIKIHYHEAMGKYADTHAKPEFRQARAAFAEAIGFAQVKGYGIRKMKN